MNVRLIERPLNVWTVWVDVGNERDILTYSQNDPMEILQDLYKLNDPYELIEVTWYGAPGATAFSAPLVNQACVDRYNKLWTDGSPVADRLRKNWEDWMAKARVTRGDRGPWLRDTPSELPVYAKPNSSRFLITEDSTFRWEQDGTGRPRLTVDGKPLTEEEALRRVKEITEQINNARDLARTEEPIPVVPEPGPRKVRTLLPE